MQVTRLWHRVGVPGHPCVQNVDGAHSSIEGMLKKNWGHIKTMDQYVSALNSLNSNKTRWYVHKLQPEQIKAYTRAYYPLFKSLSAVSQS
jgi:hypothetical protein